MKSRRPPSTKLPLTVIFAVPALLAVFSLIGLIAALVGNGVYDALSWLTLAAPIIAILWAMTTKRR
ncbi:hypothetical protein [Parvularcula marina]|uniref:hypothetical protein n=1 Tax=Parvularcula marina TaxID=2292771 RepID=UPI003514851D